MSTDTSPFDDGQLYDIMFAGVDYGVEFYVELAKSANGPVLDIGCGTGRILLPCLHAGADVDGLDLSSAMLATLRDKAEALDLCPDLFNLDMKSFDLPRKYALIMITFNAFVHNLTQTDQITCLVSCRKHLMPGGMLVFDSFFPGLGIIGAAENVRELELETTHPVTGDVLRLYDTRSFDRVAQIQHSVNEIETLDSHGKISTLQSSEFDIRWTYKQEMALLLRVAGFVRWKIAGGFDRRPLTNETDGMVVFAWTDDK